MGADHSSGPREFTDPDETWEKHGFRIKSTTPEVPARSKVRMLEDIKLSGNPEGEYSIINLPYVENSRSWDDWGVTTYKFSAAIYPTHHTESRLTFYVKLGNITLWANKPDVDHVLDVLPPKDNNFWSKQQNPTQITTQIFIGSFAATRNAAELEFDVIIRLCDRIPKKFKVPEGSTKHIFQSLSDDSGAGSELVSEKLFSTIEWLEDNRDSFQKILLVDKYGLGWVGSLMTAYIFANNPNLTFQEAVAYVMSRREVYCHKGLNETLHIFFPRE
ncbi:dual specificity phosphatase, catalytic domain protein [Plakobranchus ocellatus]|uniref:Dual specificity phosphatase, catalytic domain protein n=1 Tax=Plakobranchus ocellatus TaxID=259542 RepID=A0AAV4APK7_9GAST|nr:dual specificity phosphatase, catalytic domain protein [Plakobranchus ocellatus]